MTSHGAPTSGTSTPGPPADDRVDLLLEVSARTPSGLNDDLNRALELATGVFGLAFGIVSRVEGDAYFVEHVHQPEGGGLAVGQRFDLGHTYCEVTLAARDVVSIDDVRTTEHAGHPCYERMGLQAYLGVPLVVDGEVYGTLNFSSPDPRPRPWNETDRQLVRLLAGWVASSISQERLRERLAGALDALDEANRELARRNEDLGNFARVASHDLQAPVRKLVAFTNMLALDLGDDLPERAAEDLRFIEEAAEKMRVLVRDLFEFSRTGRARIEEQAVELDACVDAALDALHEIVAATDAEVVRSPLPAVRGQATLLTQVFQNLLGNAMKFQAPDSRPRIEIAGAREEGAVHVTVTDNGIGLPADQAERIFAPFHRLHGVSRFEGSGLGLSICKKIVDRHGGSIRAEPGPGGGAVFTLTLVAEE